MKFLVCLFILRPLVKRNYRLRKEGKMPDEWYWADEAMLKMGGNGAFGRWLYRGL